LKRIAGIGAAGLPEVPHAARLGVPLTGISKIVCVGLNYADHAAETGAPIPKEPILFLKALSALSGPNDDIMVPRGSVKTDWEVELGVVIGSRTSYVGEQEALDHVAGYCAINDVSEREYQTERGGQWDKGKGCDSFAPVGPWLVTKDEVADPQDLKLWTEVNGTRRQDGSTKTMIFGVRTLVSYISHFMTLLPGDIIATGTPPGVAMGMKPPQYLKPGDRLKLSVEGLGEQNNLLVPWRR
jgi:2-keto-4-pentenoate hydratase/2-oxohepta-3-ene-1,7-dioic acid hydratase in catechol pathway